MFNVKMQSETQTDLGYSQKDASKHFGGMECSFDIRIVSKKIVVSCPEFFKI